MFLSWKHKIHRYEKTNELKVTIVISGFKYNYKIVSIPVFWTCMPMLL